MARKKAEAQLIGALAIIALPIYLVQNVAQAVGAETIIVVVVFAIALFIFSKKRAAKQRKDFLLGKYGDVELVEKILNRYFWQGQSAEQLIDSLGNPIDVDTKVLKTKTKEVWKYHKRGANRYGLRITLENNCVIGWDQKE